jgi:hypothetical protein
MKIIDLELAIMKFLVHSWCSAVIAIVDCPEQSLFIGF